MKRLCLFLFCLLTAASCNITAVAVPKVKKPISITSPTPKNSLTKVSLSEEQQAYVNSGNAFAFKCLAELYKEQNSSMVFSPLSLQYALAMAVNGASGETAKEITTALGYGTDVKALNDFCNLLLNQLPALDLSVQLKLTDAMLVRDGFPLQDAFKQTLNDTYYAPVEFFAPASKQEIADRINEWAYRNTNGVIYPLLSANDISDEFVAAIMNALYFKAKWAGSEYDPMFREEATLKQQPFYLDGGGQSKADLMRTSDHFFYAVRDGYKVVELPYASGKFAMYVLLPDEKGKKGLSGLMAKLPSENWNGILSSLDRNIQVNVRLPKFDTESSFQLPKALKALGIKRAFDSSRAEFDSMFNAPGWQFWVGNIFQKAKITVAEWGTEAAAVTVMVMDGCTATAPDPRELDFFCDHPFVYIIAERGTGTILFEGIYDGK